MPPPVGEPILFYFVFSLACQIQVHVTAKAVPEIFSLAKKSQIKTVYYQGFYCYNVSMRANIPLIVGAGPVGLAAALFLSHHNIQVRIIDAAIEPSPYSRALAVNPRTLDLLEHTGVTQRMLASGGRMDSGQISQQGKPVAEIDISKLKHRYPFMLTLSQAATERLLAEALNAIGVDIERGVKLTEIYQDENGIRAEIEKDGQQETINPTWVLAADGAHSLVRHLLQIDFPGDALKEEWYLADVPLDTSLSRNKFHAAFFEHGKFTAYIPVVDDVLSNGSTSLWRLIGNFPFSLESDAFLKPIGQPVWESKFRISHRLAETFAVGNIYLAGDAAHIHSPLGARGMNLGIEDAYVFAELMANGRIDKYAKIRREVDAKVIKRIKFVTEGITRADSKMIVFVRKHLLKYLLRIPFIRNSILKTATGLDHPVNFE